jgi:hypothetical protein
MGSGDVSEVEGFIAMGTASGGFVFLEPAAVVHDVSRMGRTAIAAAGLTSVRAASETSMLSQCCGRGTQDRFRIAVFAAQRAACKQHVCVYFATKCNSTGQARVRDAAPS